MAGAPAARGLDVVADQDYALIVLIYDGLVDLLPLIHQEFLRPDNLRQGITYSH